MIGPRPLRRIHRARRGRVLLAVAGAALLGPLAASDVGAIPPGGADPDTPGTTVTVTPTQLRAGDTISFTVTGFPGGETINVKIDDGTNCTASAVHGACVYHQQAIPSSGTVTGRFAVPADLAPGEHWLRFLASQPITDSSGNQIGVKGFTLRGDSDFVVVAGVAGSPSGGDAAPADAPTAPGSDPGAAPGAEPGASAPGAAAPSSGGGSTGGPAAGSADGSAADDEIGVVDPGDEAPTSSVPTDDKDTGSERELAAASSSTDDGSGFPVIGVVVLLLAVAGSAAAVVLVRRRARGVGST